ncbi:receptor-type tyrosine-protein phosphatase beta [Brachionichthys hirsutus]|uniref:receptor-type tyrosine-protein phosphatase beta n=1 Tax=Brachionichthys hirsutus TaxID=412623 RepID=UPI003604B24D
MIGSQAVLEPVPAGAGPSWSRSQLERSQLEPVPAGAGPRWSRSQVEPVPGGAGPSWSRSQLEPVPEPEAVRNLTVTDVSTDSVSLTWTEPRGKSSSYIVEWSAGAHKGNVNAHGPSETISNLGAGLEHLISVAAVAEDEQTTGEKVQVSLYTKPKAVTDLRVEHVTTTAVTLAWLRQSDHKPSYSYLVTARQDATTVHSESTHGENHTFLGLTPGERYAFDVFSVVGGVSSTVKSTSEYTRPTKPGSLTAAARGMNHLNISWASPEGTFDHFEVNISNEELHYISSITTTDAAAHFPDLLPGRMYVIAVTAVAGPFRNSSDQASFATFPSPPGSILVAQKTNSSLHLEWATPALMEAAPHISYRLWYHPAAGRVRDQNTTDNNTELSPLSSGTSYNITVVSVGPQMPNPVRNLAARPKSTTAVEVKWSHPPGAQSYYKYLVQTYNATEQVFNATISLNGTDVPNLEPGSRYGIKVRTIASAGSASTEEEAFSYTKPKAVTDLRVEHVTTTAVTLAWLRQSDHKPSYSYLVTARQDATTVHSESTHGETHTFLGLTPGERYAFDVFSVVEGVSSTVKSTSEYTKPAAVSDITVIGSTTNLSVSWRPAPGQVSSYAVHLFRDNQSESSDTNLSNNTFTSLFLAQKPGVLYCVLLVTTSGPFESASSRVCNATFPNPPGPVTVESQTEGSIRFTWPHPEDMDHHQYEFLVSSLNGPSLTENDWFLLDNLQSGTLYRIAVVTVGVWNYTSTAVTAGNYTKPAVVPNITVIGSTTSLSVSWRPAPGQVSSYAVHLFRDNQSESSDTNLSNNTFTSLFLAQKPGVLYCVLLVTTSGPFESASSRVCNATFPNPPGPVTVESQTEGSIRFTWPHPEDMDHHQYEFLVSSLNGPSLTENDWFLLDNLQSGTLYRIAVVTVGVWNYTSTAVTAGNYTKPAVVPNITVIGSTTNLSVSWRPAPGQVSSYAVHLFRDNQSESSDTNLSNNTFTSLFLAQKPGVLYCVLLVTTSGPFESASSRVCNATFPNPPGPVTVESQTEGSIRFTWPHPEDMDHHQYEFLVSSLNGPSLTENDWFLLDNLQSGTLYRIAVVTVGVWNYTSTAVTAGNYTKPAVVPNITVIGSTTNLSVSWRPAPGQVSSYAVHLFRDNQSESSDTNLSNNTFTSLFLAQKPGVLYCVLLVTTSGPFESASSRVCNATFPNPPGPVTVESQTEGSIRFTWPHPEDMDHHQYEFLVSSLNGPSLTENDWFLLDNLQSGTLYRIAVVTVGVWNYTSTAVTAGNYTKPAVVSDITVIGSTTNLSVSWRPAPGQVSSYAVHLFRDNQSESSDTNLSNNTFTSLFLAQKPGVLYCVLLVTTSGPFESASSRVCNATFPNPPGPVTVESQTEGSIRFTWPHPEDMDHHQYEFLVSSLNGPSLTENDWFLLDNLQSGTLYRIAVVTVGVWNYTSTAVTAGNYTKPAVVSDITVIGSTTNLSVSWRPAPGQVSSYAVHLFRDNQSESSDTNLSNNTFTSLFLAQKPGVLYCVLLVTTSGPFESASSRVCNATFPNPPGPVTVESQTEGSIRFTWPHPEDMDHHQYEFLVSSLNGPSLTENDWFLLDNLQSGTLYRIAVVTVGVWNYTSTAVTAGNYTKITTATVTLVWEQQESKPHYTYVVSASNGSEVHLNTVITSTDTITGLVAGSNYSFTVTSQTADGTMAAPVTVSHFTRPEAVQPSISSRGSNDSILVSWSRAPGEAQYYQVGLSSSAPTPQELVGITNGTAWLFERLSAGKLYVAMVTTCSGPVSASSGFVSNATFPNPPGPVDILTKTTGSISIKWQEAPLMSGVPFHYRLTITPPQRGVRIPSGSNRHSFGSLLSGTPYHISVATVGAMDLESEPVGINRVNTRPFSVKHLGAATEEESLMLTWDRPDEYKDGYTYNVTWQSSDGASGIVTREAAHRIDGLVPGRLYNLSVTTETADGTPSAPRQIHSCTSMDRIRFMQSPFNQTFPNHSDLSLCFDAVAASPVTNLRCEGPDRTEAEVVLSWSRPRGHYAFFRVSVNDSGGSGMTSSCCSRRVAGLLHFSVYELSVETLSCGRPSAPVSCHCRTGITDPPIPENVTSLVEVSEKVHNRFSLQIDSRLLNNTNGPITHVGVLVTQKLPDETTNWKNYLGKTYDQWKAKETPVYLATVREIILQSRSAESQLSLAVGDESKWEGYTNGLLVTSGKYQYAVVLFTSLSLQDNMVNTILGIAIGATLGIFAFLFIVLMGFVIYWRRLSKKELSDIQIYSLRAKASVGVKMEDYEPYYRKQKADSNCGFAEEFEDLKAVGTDQSKTNALSAENKPKNRYNNVLPYDCSRVKLSIVHGSPYDDYINASYVPGYNSRKEFIASQGPLPATVNEFWRMIWEKNVQTLVMLARCSEQGRVKCERYWDSGSKHFENITVTTISEIPLEDWTIRDISIKNVKTAETRLVRHFHFTAWPDHGVPETTELLISFRHLVREHTDQYSRHSPTVVHCSAGVGRTGTFIAIDRLIFQIERENIVDVYGIVHDMRLHRPLMVQTEDQYVFLNQCAMDIIRSRTGTNVDLIYQNVTALSAYENTEPKEGYPKNGSHNT